MQHYPDNINPCAVSLVTHFLDAHLGNKVATIFEFGCSTGALGAHLLQDHRIHKWFGCDYNEAALDIASRRLSNVQQLDLNSDSVNLLGIFSVFPDLIVMVDVLEHLYEPFKFISHIRNCFPEAMIACILPNISCLSIVESLISRDFTYQDHGILDRTHRYFFTPSSAIDFFAKADYTLGKGPDLLLEPTLIHNLESAKAFPFSVKAPDCEIVFQSRNDLAVSCSYGFDLLLAPRCRINQQTIF